MSPTGWLGDMTARRHVLSHARPSLEVQVQLELEVWIVRHSHMHIESQS